jgi:hypothetical protein
VSQLQSVKVWLMRALLESWVFITLFASGLKAYVEAVLCSIDGKEQPSTLRVKIRVKTLNRIEKMA